MSAGRRTAELTFLRLVPGDTVVHRLWAGTKLLVAATIALALSLRPTWGVIGVSAAVVVLALLAGRIPLGAFPRLPRWFVLFVAVGAVLNLAAGVDPKADIGPVELSLGGLELWVRFTVLAIVLIASGAVVGWTTPLADIAPALGRLCAPLRWVRVPVDEWIVATALAIRCLPLLIDEIRTLNAARLLRAGDLDEFGRPAKRSVQRTIMESHDLLSTAIVASLRRGRDLADAMVARGGIGGAVSADVRGPRVRDWAVLAGIAVLYGMSLWVLHL